MKKIIITLAGVFAITFAAIADDKPIQFERLPLEAKNFINVNFQGVKVLYTVQDDDIIFPEYTVALDNGFKIQFTNGGALEKIESNGQAIPEGLIPYQIRDYVKVHYPDATFREYEAGRKSYEVKLSNRLELKFNKKFNLIEIDD